MLKLTAPGGQEMIETQAIDKDAPPDSNRRQFAVSKQSADCPLADTEDIRGLRDRDQSLRLRRGILLGHLEYLE